jgi:hypothetical protein
MRLRRLGSITLGVRRSLAVIESIIPTTRLASPSASTPLIIFCISPMPGSKLSIFVINPGCSTCLS